jgi:KDO2-lipid IV(A) lauroyltransferase
VKNAPLLHRFEFTLYRGVKRAIVGRPHARVRDLGHRLGRLGFRLLGKHRRLVLTNLEKALPDLSADERLLVARKCFEHFGAAFFEAVSAERFDEADVDRLFEVEGWEHVEAALAGGRGALLLASHFGCWQVSIFAIGLKLGGLHVVVRPPDNPLIAKDMKDIREHLGNTEVPRAGAGHRVLNLARRGNAVGLVIDQRPPPNQGTLLDFLGRPARVTTMPALIASHTGVAGVPATSYPAPGGGYRVRFGPPIEPEGKGPEAVEALTRRFLAPLEQEIREQPHLWMWMHDRWRV